MYVEPELIFVVSGQVEGSGIERESSQDASNTAPAYNRTTFPHPLSP